MVSNKLQEMLNEQIKNEWESEFIYLGMSAWFFNNNYDGFGNWMLKQAGEEHEHGMRILRYLNEADCDIIIPDVSPGKADITGVEDIFAKGLKHEQKITGLINKLTEQALAEKDYTTQQFLSWFVNEQLEEESSFRDILNKLERIKGSASGLLFLEGKLGSRD
jgi:ferritin